MSMGDVIAEAGGDEPLEMAIGLVKEAGDEFSKVGFGTVASVLAEVKAGVVVGFEMVGSVLAKVQGGVLVEVEGTEIADSSESKSPK